MKIPKFLRTLAPLCAVALAATLSAAQVDTDFMMKTVQAGMAEVELGKLAVAKSADGSVKSFGEMMVSDHNKANEEFAALAKKKGLTVATSLDKTHQQMADDLGKATGKDFDKRYIKQMVAAHRTVASDFEAYLKDGTDAEVKAWVTKTLPTIKAHLAKAEEIERSMS